MQPTAIDANSATNVDSVIALLPCFAGSALGLFAGLSDADGGAGPLVVALVALLAGSGSATVALPAATGLEGPTAVRLPMFKSAGPLALLPLLLPLLPFAAVGGGTGRVSPLPFVAAPARDGADELVPNPGGPATIDGAPPELGDADICSTPGLLGVSLQLSVLQQQISLLLFCPLNVQHLFAACVSHVFSSPSPSAHFELMPVDVSPFAVDSPVTFMHHLFAVHDAPPWLVVDLYPPAMAVCLFTHVNDRQHNGSATNSTTNTPLDIDILLQHLLHSSLLTVRVV